MNTIEDIELLQPKTLAEALTLMADDKTRGVPIAGGTDLMVQWEAGARPVPERAVNMRALRELQGIRETGDIIEIGACVTHRELRNSVLVQHHLPALSAAAATIGGHQIQAMGTIGGSLANASPAGDLAPALLVAEGHVWVASAAGERKIEIQKFCLGYRKVDLRSGELIIRISLNKMPEGSREGFRKLGARAAQAISKVMGSWRAKAEGGKVADIRVALGSVAPTAVRLPAVEKFLAGRVIDAAVLDEVERLAAESVQPITDIRSTAEYRKWVAGRLVRSFVEETVG